MARSPSNAKQVYRCIITGQVVKQTGKRGRPREFVNDDARRLQQRLQQVEGLLPGLVGLMTDQAAKELRARMWALANLVNR